MKPYHWIFLGLLTLGTVVLEFFGKPNPHPHAWDKIPLFYAAFGFAGCALIIGVAKGLAKAFLQQPEDYYDRNS